MERESEFDTEFIQNDNIHHLVQKVITEINETFKEIQSSVSKRKTMLIREVSVMENKLRRQRMERKEDAQTLIRARETLEEVLNSNKYKELKQDLLIRLDDSMEKESDYWKREEFRFISTGLNQLKECIAKFGNIAQFGREEEFQAFEDDSHLSLSASHIASPLLPRRFKWQATDRQSVTRQVSTPLHQLHLPTTLPRPMSSHRLSDLSPRFQVNPFEKFEDFANVHSKIPRKNSYNH